ncbi:MAG: radical SAM protein [Firmicutes bacterium]|nr:radical SAM protein [Bacillota bacterium]
MKMSRYNFFVEDDHGVILAYNALSGAFACIDRELYRQFLKVCSNPHLMDEYNGTDEDDKKLSYAINQFKKGGFLIEDSIDEIDILKKKQYHMRFQQSNMLSMTIVPTLDCNFKCVYCYEGICKDRYRMTRDTADHIIKYINDFSPNKGILRITWFGGEPTLALNIIYYISNAVKDILSKKQAGYFSIIFTNGYLLDKKVASELRRCGVEEACITIDGYAEGHNARRPLRNGGNTFQTIMSNIIDISDIMNVCVRYSVDRDNIKEFSGFLDILEESNVAEKIRMEIVRIEAYPYSIDAVKSRALSTFEFSAIFYELAEQAVKRKIKIDFLPAKDRGACSALLANHVVVAPRGELHKCTYTIWNPDESFGKIDRPFEWNENLEKWMDTSPIDNENCKNCRILPICMGGCLRNMIIKDTAPTNTEGCCMQYKYNIEKFLKLKYRQSRIKSESL